MNQRAMIAATAAAVMTLSMVAPATAATDKEKCFGIAKAGQNDCASISGAHSCAGQSKVDMDKMEWKYVAKGTCKDMKGLTAEEATASCCNAARILIFWKSIPKISLPAVARHWRCWSRGVPCTR